MSPREEAPPPNLLKPYPATLCGLRCAKCEGGGMDALCGACARAEVRALRRERRALRKALRSVQVLLTPVDGSDSFERRRLREARDSVNEALKPRKARRRKA